MTSNLLSIITGAPDGDRSTMLANIRRGLRYEVVEILAAEYGISVDELADILLIPASTLRQRKKQGRLRADESDRVARLARLKDSAVRMLHGDENAAIQWLHSPLEVLGHETPMRHASTEIGARNVEDLIGRIRHGVFS